MTGLIQRKFHDLRKTAADLLVRWSPWIFLWVPFQYVTVVCVDAVWQTVWFYGCTFIVQNTAVLRVFEAIQSEEMRMVGSPRTYFADEGRMSCCRVTYCGLACSEITVAATNRRTGRNGTGVPRSWDRLFVLVSASSCTDWQRPLPATMRLLRTMRSFTDSCYGQASTIRSVISAELLLQSIICSSVQIALIHLISSELNWTIQFFLIQMRWDEMSGVNTP